MRRFFLQCLTLVGLVLYSNCTYAGFKVGDLAPDFAITNMEGRQIKLSSLKGNVVLLDFWASWCMPCRMANTEIVPVYHNYASLGFDIFSVSLDSKAEPWKNAIRNDKMDWPYHGSDLKGWESSAAKLYQIESLPSSFLINESGIIVAMDLDGYDLEKKLHEIFFNHINFYPAIASEKIYFTGKAKFEIINESGVTTLKGKGEEVDITGLAQGSYTIKVNDKPLKFQKIGIDGALATFYPTRVDDQITLSRDVVYEIYSHAGRRMLHGKGKLVDCSNLKTGSYHLSLEGKIHDFFKK